MKCTTSIAKLKSEFTLKQATSHAGSKPLLAYLEKIQLERVFQRISLTKGGNSLFSFAKILLYLLVGWLLGCERIFHFRFLQHDALVTTLSGRTLSASYAAAEGTPSSGDACSND